MDADDLLTLLQEGRVDEFNERRGRRARLELFAADLSGAKLRGVDLSGAVLDKADLSGADLSDAVLAKASLLGADLSETVLTGAMAMQARFRECIIEDCAFDNADLSGADFSDAELSRTRFDGATLANARFKRAQLADCSFKQVEGAEASFSGAALEGCAFQGAELREARFKGAAFTGGSLYGADLTRAQLHEVQLEGTDLEEAVLHSADLSGAQLQGARLSGADLTRADLSGIDPAGVRFDGATLTEAEVPPELLHLTLPPRASLGPAHLADATFATDGRSVGATWTEEDAEGHPWIRVGVAAFGADGLGPGHCLPVPAELVISTSICATPSGYLVLALIDRPAGVAAHLFPLGGADTGGSPGAPRRIHLPYKPMVRPLLEWREGALHICGISASTPPVLSVLRVGEGPELDARHASQAGTLRGFASEHHAVILSKGGTLAPVSPQGPGKLRSVPNDFPGKSCGVAIDADGQMFLAWVPGTGRGLALAEAQPGQADEPTVVHRKIPVSACDAIGGAEGAWALALRPDERGGKGLEAFAVELPDGKPIPLRGPEGRSARVPRMAAGGEVVLGIVVWDDGSATAWSLGDAPEVVWRT
jgi:uncharacterized protein YjbI with pentapeptide repeats